MGSIWPSSPRKDIAEPAMAFHTHLEATIAFYRTSSLPYGVVREGLALAWRSCGVSCLRCSLADDFRLTASSHTTTQHHHN
jgi:hypothetical protein